MTALMITAAIQCLFGPASAENTQAAAEDSQATVYTLPQPSILPTERVLPPEKGWEPPVIDPEAAKDTEPWLLVIKVAQEELGYVEGPGKDESKYGDWYAGKQTAWCAEFLTWCVNEADTRYGTTMLRDIYPMYGKAKEGDPNFYEPSHFDYEKFQITTGSRIWWKDGFDPKYYLQPFPDTEVNKGYGLSQNAGW